MNDRSGDSWLIGGAGVLLGDQTDFQPGWIEIAQGRIAAVGLGPCPRPPDQWVSGLIGPGLVDVHCHGGGGASFADPDPDQVAAGLAVHRRSGTTCLVASLVSASWEVIEAQLDRLRPWVESGDLAGVHLEGPWLAPGKRGAHDPDLLSWPTAEAVDRVLAQRDIVRMVTIAPELPGALLAIERLSAAGVVAAIGHTEADLATTVAAIAAGARGATHLFNAMPPLSHRAPGPVLALLRDQRVFCELIADGHHVDLDLVGYVLAQARGRAVLITDAMAAAGMGDGSYELGGLPVEVADGVARLAGQTTIAGSTIRLAQAVANVVADGLPLPQALAAATSGPAAYLGLTEVGRIAPGRWADLVEVSPTGQVSPLLRRGRPEEKTSTMGDAEAFPGF
ncbi:MAG: N-acetylglucosamine-6-phosphate deacetylase [Propionibacteriaceae bacterium]|jgi:N-acetylglucosamine-6-phosphate deacetylase|nr:N-acetylglucosamine-6-phosphate deacetylase [Propionibacteriaceae bacterium]